MKKFYVCPLCKVKGEQIENNSIVYFHTTTDNKGNPITHKWSINSGRLFRLKADDDDSVW